MPNYRRDRTMGGSYFFTVNLLNRQSNLLTQHIDALRNAHRHMIAKHPVCIDAMVVLPDHMHAIWTLAENDDDYSKRWQLFKSLFSSSIPKDQQPHRSKSRVQKRELGIWQRRFWDESYTTQGIRDEEDFQRHMDYIHYNPVKHGYVASAKDWEYSTFHRYVKIGVYMADWGGGGCDINAE